MGTAHCFPFFQQRKLREVSTKFQLFQKPANFEQRMLDCKRVLDGVKAELHVLRAKGVGPDVLQSHLDECMVRPRRPGRVPSAVGLRLLLCVVCPQCAETRGQ